MATPMTPAEYLTSFLPSREEITHFLTPRGADGLNPNRGWTYDAELGWVHADAAHAGDGVRGSDTTYHYEADGARRMLHGAGRPCRIHTFGDSFTHGDQVNDGQTWQEYLAGHLDEPVRNYGVGGYSVYQAYRRLRRVAAGATPPADYIILNLWEDDHYRNLDAWRRLRFGRQTVCGYTLPHLRVDLQQGTCRECENLLRTPDEVYRLGDPAWVIPTFQDDPVLRLVLAGRQTAGTSAAALEPVAVSFGLPPDLVGADAAGEALRQLHTRAALLATRHTLERTEYFCRATGRQLLVVLSFGRRNLAAGIRGEPRFDQPLLDYLATRPYPVVDTRDTFAADFAHSRLDLEAYLDRLYVGHHTPYGNYLTAEALLPIVVPWLQPPPRSYPHGWPER